MTLDPEVLGSDEFKAAVKKAVESELGGLMANRDKLLGENADLKKLVAGFDGVDVKEAKRAIKALREAEEETARRAGDFDKLKASLEESHKAQLKQVAEERDGLQKSLEQILIERDAIEGITQADGFVKILKPHVTGKMELRKVDGKHVAVVLDEKGEPRLKKGASSPTDFMPVKEFVESLRDDDEFGHAFKGAGASGGATPHRGVEHGGGPKPKSKDYVIL